MTSPLLKVENLTKIYTVPRGFLKPHAEIKALNHVSFELLPKQTFAIVGESGSGKSTLAKQIVKSEQPTSGNIWLEGNNISQLSGKARRHTQRQIRMIFQNPYASLNPRWRVYDILESPLKYNSALDAKARQAKIYNMLEKVGLDTSHAKRYPHMFSGGQRQRIAIARALILEPKIVIADEAIAALDVSIQAQILALLKTLQNDLDITYLFISHDLGVVKHLCDQMLVMYFGYAVEYGSVKDIYQAPKHPYTLGLLNSTPKLNKGKRHHKDVLKGELPSPFNPPSGCPFHSRCPLATNLCREKMPELRSFANREVACHHADKM